MLREGLGILGDEMNPKSVYGSYALTGVIGVQGYMTLIYLKRNSGSIRAHDPNFRVHVVPKELGFRV